jgi:hypothetical protein
VPAGRMRRKLAATVGCPHRAFLPPAATSPRGEEAEELGGGSPTGSAQATGRWTIPDVLVDGAGGTTPNLAVADGVGCRVAADGDDSGFPLAGGTGAATSGCWRS